MPAEVYANMMAVSCKAASGKSICAFPDVCFTPPQTPATPPGVPIPYPNTGMASDATDGSSSVKIGGQEVMLKNKSYFKRSTGDEAGCAPKKGLVNSKNMGKVYFTMWSMDVIVEGENVVRHLDVTVGNNACPMPNAATPWPHIDKQATPKGGKCAGNIKDEKTACAKYEPYTKPGKNPCPGKLGGEMQKNAKWAAEASEDAKDPCVQARRCRLVPFNEKRNGIDGCCPGQTPHHVIPKSAFFDGPVSAGKISDETPDYKPNEAPCMCLEGTNNTHGDHGLGHTAHAYVGADEGMVKGEMYPLDEHTKVCAKSVKEVAPQCNEDCLKQQVKTGHEQAGVSGNPDAKHSPSGRTKPEKQEEARAVLRVRQGASAGSGP